MQIDLLALRIPSDCEIKIILNPRSHHGLEDAGDILYIYASIGDASTSCATSKQMIRAARAANDVQLCIDNMVKQLRSFNAANQPG